MKIQKIGAWVGLSLCAIIAFTLAANKAPDISIDLTNAQQHISSVNFIDSWNNAQQKSSFSSIDEKVNINTTNFVISSENNSNQIWNNAKLTNILWGISNTIADAIASTIVAWESNKINSDYSIIWWWKSNTIWNNSDYSVIAGGEWNSIIGQNSTIAGWKWNSISGNYSAIWWSNNTVNWNYSVALWSGASVNANNSFLWTDGNEKATISTNDVFAIISKSWMVVNTTGAHPLAQLTIWWSLTIAWSGNVQCGNGKWKWSLKLVNKSKTSNQKCLCSCNWKWWDSILGDWECVARCALGETLNMTPKCWSGLDNWTGLSLIIDETWNQYYSWSCEQWEVVFWSYYLSASGVNWSCQERDGTSISCLYKLKCKWANTLPEHTQINNLIWPKLPETDGNDWTYHYSDKKWEICSYSCEYGYYRNGSSCTAVCNTWNLADTKCFTGTKSKWLDTYTQTWDYTCTNAICKDEFWYTVCSDVICKIDCGNDKVWDWTKCITKKNSYCDTNHYWCLDWLTGENKRDVFTWHTWNCKNSQWKKIGESCREAKTIHNVSLCEHINRSATENIITHDVHFTLSEILPAQLTVKLPWTWVDNKSNTSDFIITWGNTSALHQIFKYSWDVIKFWNPTTVPLAMATENDYYKIFINSGNNCKSENFVCYGNLSTWAIVTITTPSSNSNVKYFYSTTTSQACSFKCWNWYHYESAWKVCCKGTNSGANDYEIFTGGKCRAPDHWEWRFKNNPNSYTISNTNPREKVTVYWIYFSTSNSSTLIGKNTVNLTKTSRLRNVPGKNYLSNFTDPSFFSWSNSSNNATVTIKWSDFYQRWIPLLQWTTKPRYTLAIETGNLYKDIIKLTFNSSQPNVIRDYAPKSKTSKTIYVYAIRWWVGWSSTPYVSTVEAKLLGSITAETSPIYKND